MKIELTPDAAQFVEAELAAGRFTTAEDVVRHAIHQMKVMALRSAIDSAIAEGGSKSADDVRKAIDRTLTSNRVPAGAS